MRSSSRGPVLHTNQAKPNYSIRCLARVYCEVILSLSRRLKISPNVRSFHFNYSNFFRAFNVLFRIKLLIYLIDKSLFWFWNNKLKNGRIRWPWIAIFIFSIFFWKYKRNTLLCAVFSKFILDTSSKLFDFWRLNAELLLFENGRLNEVDKFLCITANPYIIFIL